MMPGIRSFGRVGASPVLDHSSSLRLQPPSSIDLRRQLQQLQQTQQAFPPANAPQPKAQGFQAALGPKDRPLAPQEVPQVPVYPAQGSITESRCSGYSSGSEHEPSSEYLSNLVSDFMEVEDQPPSARGPRAGPGSPSDDDDEDSAAALRELTGTIQALSSSASPAESRLLSDVLCAVQLARSTAALLSQDADCPTQSGGAFLRRAVMSRLRAAGYNAAVCKSRWDHSRGFPGGDYEYIDVLLPHPEASAAVGSSSLDFPARERLVVDLDFRAQFQIARPTEQFEAALLAAPGVFVGRVERLQQLLELLSDAGRRSLRTQGMHLPPWRKAEYLRAKWLAPYKRTTNPSSIAAPASVPAPAPAAAPSPQGIPIPRQQTSSSGGPALVSQLSFELWPEATRGASSGMKANCQPVQRRGSAAPRGVLGMLLQEHLGKTSPVS